MASLFKTGSDRNLPAESFGALLLVCAALQLVEGLLPKIPLFPWLRLGLSYLVILPVLVRFGVKAAAGLLLGRNLLALLYGGQLFSSFIISSFSGLMTFTVAGFLVRRLMLGGILGWTGAGLVMACLFNVSQLVLVNLLFVAHAGFYFQLPYLLGWSAVSGALVAAAAGRSAGLWQPFFQGETKVTAEAVLQPRHTARLRGVILPASLLIGLFLAPWYQVQAIAACLALPFAGWRRIKILFLAWPFFLYLVWLHLFQTDGVYIFRDWITREGLLAFAYYGLRTLNIILIGQFLAVRIQPDWFRRFNDTVIRGTMLAVPYVPALFGVALSSGKSVLKKLLRGNFTGFLEPLIVNIHKMLKEGKTAAKTGSSE